MNKKKVAAYQRLNTPSYSRRRKHYKKKSTVRNRLLLLLLLLLLAAGGYAYYIYASPAGRLQEMAYVFIKPGEQLDEVTAELQKKLWLRYPSIFSRLASFKGLGEKLRPGRYAVTPKMTMSDVIQTLSEGEQAPVKITMGALRTSQEITKHITSHLLLPQSKLDSLLADPNTCASYGLNPHSIRSLFVRGDYEVLWDTSAEDLMDTVYRHYKRLWTDERVTKASALGYTPAEITALSAIVEAESSKLDEYPRIAGLYINRLRKNIPLQSDPTVKFALGNFSLKRILYDHLKVQSPYNTYQVKGLTPGPICIPRSETIDKVLSAEEHQYLYMCARETFDGYHNFATTYAEHLANSRRYQKALDERGIK